MDKSGFISCTILFVLVGFLSPLFGFIAWLSMAIMCLFGLLFENYTSAEPQPKKEGDSKISNFLCATGCITFSALVVLGLVSQLWSQ